MGKRGMRKGNGRNRNAVKQFGRRGEREPGNKQKKKIDKKKTWGYIKKSTLTKTDFSTLSLPFVLFFLCVCFEQYFHSLYLLPPMYNKAGIGREIGKAGKSVGKGQVSEKVRKCM